MTSDAPPEDAAPPTPPDPPPSRWRQARKSLGLIFTVVVGVATIAGTVYTIFVAPGDDDSAGATNSDEVQSETGETRPAEPTDSVPDDSDDGAPDDTEWQVGTCLLAPSDPGPCDALHYWEVYSLDMCSADTLMEYLGGIAGIDVLTTSLETTEVTLESATLCEVHTPLEGGDLRSARDILTDAAGDAWRRCIDARVDREVGCATDHTAEVVYAGDEDVVDCPGRADTYLEAPLSRFDGQLTVVQAGTIGNPVCIVQVLGDNVLVGSVRSIKTSAPPIAAATSR